MSNAADFPLAGRCALVTGGARRLVEAIVRRLHAGGASVAVLGSAFTRSGMSWYRTLDLPSWTPPGSTIGLVWTTIFVLAAVPVHLWSTPLGILPGAANSFL